MVVVVVIMVLKCNFLVLKLNYYRFVNDYLRIWHHGLSFLIRVMLRTSLSFGLFDRLLLGDALWRRLDMQGRVVRRSVDGRALREREHRRLNSITAERELWVAAEPRRALYFAEGLAVKSLICH